MWKNTTMSEYLTVKNLILKLQEVENQDAIISVTSNNFELNGAKIPASGVRLFRGSIEKDNFLDAFDGGDYSATVIKCNGMVNVNSGEVYLGEFVELM